ncbi:type IV toxin-antitoxin system AbiEi family antitoxin domain-containing protein [Demequina lutea]|uniref:Very-short-patch-repair endonuclease n=1 Tax=Demequina lutea TaxID=431489 RepID=A0A7Y9Z9T0_9MICO|nr:type IV toxin-antitoxin system AbiEi family antitoxin domain-containing protein [Demequina lutea]NYI40298.1 very-short-patch-repair endonuclease [Demequina lutea]
MDIVRVLDELGGAARRTELLLAGVPERSLRRSVLDGRVKKLGHGTYSLPWAAPEVAIAKLFRASLGCVTACEHWGLPVWEDHGLPHLVVPWGRSSSRRDPRERTRAVLHRTSAPFPSALWVPVAQAIDQAGWCTTPVGQLVLVDAALHSGVLMPGDLAQFEVRGARRRAWLRRMASGAAESPLETVARAAFVTAGLSVKEQVIVPGVGRVDLVVEDTVAVELDGWEFHRSRDAFERDRTRDRLMLTRNLPVMRFTARDLRSDPQAILAQVAEVAEVVSGPVRRDTARRLAWVFGLGR